MLLTACKLRPDLRMTSHNQLQAVKQEVEKVCAQIDKAEGELAKAKAETDTKEVDFLRNTLVELHRKENTLLEQKTILLQVQAPGLSLSDQLFRERFRQELELVNAEPPSKRSRTARQAYSTLPTADCDEVKLWIEEVQKKHVPCEIATFEDLLGTCHKDRRLLPDLRYLQLLLAKPSQLRKEISKLINMRLTRPISPHVDSELEYHPITLALFQFAALGQHGLCFQPELHDVNDSAREDIRCCIDGEPLEPSEITASEFYPTTKDPDGIHSNSAGLSKG
ncbi:hypothetical protein WJX82_001588 [Trebouxia sp. C0006]